MRRLRSLWAQLAIVAALLGLATPAAVLVLVTQTTDDRMVALLDADLDTQAREWARYRSGVTMNGPASLCDAAGVWLAEQRDHPASQLQLIECGDGRVVANHPELEARAHDEAAGVDGRSGLFRAPDGYSEVRLGAGESLRVLSVPVVEGSRRIGTLRIADSLRPVDRMIESLRWIALGTGIPIALASAALLALLADRLTRPLGRVAEVAGDVAAGDFSHRSLVRSGASEVVAVSSAFDAMLDRVAESRDRERRFVSSASHELRTPLTVLRMEAETLERFAGVEGRRLIRQVDVLNALVGDLLTLAVADEDVRALVRLAEVDVASFCEDTERDLPLFGDRRFSVRPESGVIEADARRLDQVIRNLVTNAVRYTETDDTIAVTFVGSDDGWLTISVADTGAGMTPEDAERAFDRLHRGPRRDATGGTGLGLPICRALVAAHGGTIDLASEFGRGTTVTVRLPGYRRRPAVGAARNG